MWDYTHTIGMYRYTAKRKTKHISQLNTNMNNRVISQLVFRHTVRSINSKWLIINEYMQPSIYGWRNSYRKALECCTSIAPSHAFERQIDMPVENGIFNCSLIETFSACFDQNGANRREKRNWKMFEAFLAKHSIQITYKQTISDHIEYDSFVHKNEKFKLICKVQPYPYLV